MLITHEMSDFDRERTIPLELFVGHSVDHFNSRSKSEMTKVGRSIHLHPVTKSKAGLSIWGIAGKSVFWGFGHG